MDNDLRDLFAFLTVVRAGGFRDGARSNGVSASRLSENVRLAPARRPACPASVWRGGRIEELRARRGRRHSQRWLLACILCAVVSGAKGSTEIEERIERMSPAMLRRLRCRRNAAGQYVRSSESTVRRLLQRIPVQSLQKALRGWPQRQAAASNAGSKKTLRDRPRRQDAARFR